MRQKVFIYGTLKRGFPNHDEWMSGFACLGPHRTLLAFPLVIGGGWYSVQMLPEPGRGLRVSGELYGMDEDGLGLLDRLEGVGQTGGYVRRQIDVEALNGDIVKNVWTYFKDRALVDPIHSQPLSHYELDPRYVPDRLRSKTHGR